MYKQFYFKSIIVVSLICASIVIYWENHGRAYFAKKYAFTTGREASYSGVGGKKIQGVELKGTTYLNESSRGDKPELLLEKGDFITYNVEMKDAKTGKVYFTTATTGSIISPIGRGYLLRSFEKIMLDIKPFAGAIFKVYIPPEEGFILEKDNPYLSQLAALIPPEATLEMTAELLKLEKAEELRKKSGGLDIYKNFPDLTK